MNKQEKKSQVRKGRSAFFWLFATLMLIVVVPVMLFTTYQISLSQDLVFAERANYLHTSANDLAKGLDVSIGERNAVVSRLAANDLIMEYLADENGVRQDPKILAFLKEMNAVIDYDVLFMTNSKGICVTSTNPSFVGNDYTFRPYFTSAAAGNQGFYVAVGIMTDVPGFFFSAPVYDKGHFVGVVAGKCRIEDVTCYFKALSDSSSMKIMLVTEDGVVIAANEPSMMLKSIGSLPPETVEKFRSSRQFAERAIPSLGHDDLWDKITSNNEQGDFEFADTGSDRTNIAVFKQLKTSNWRVIVAEDQQVLFTHAKTQITMLIIAGIVACAAIALGAYCASEIMTKSIRNVSKIISQISDGDHSVRLEAKGPRELRTMCVAFNEMVDRLVHSHHQLQRDATELLEKNKMLEMSEKRQKLIFESSPIGMVMIDARKQIVEANNSALKILKQQKEDIIGRKCDAVFCATDNDRCPIFNLGETVDLSERIALSRDGQQIPVLKSVVKIDLDGEPMLLEAFVDISDRKKAEVELESALAGIEETSQELARKVQEIDHYNRVIDDREQALAELKTEVQTLKSKLGDAGQKPERQIPSEDN